MLAQAEIERVAQDLYREAGFPGDEAVAPFRLATALLGATAVRRFRGLGLRTDAYLARVGDRWRIYLREGLSPAVARFDLAHELAEWALRRLQSAISPEETEATADALAAALLAPRPYAAAIFRSRGARWSQLALDFGATESCAALRYGEVTGCPLVLVTPVSVRERGEPMSWPDDRVLRASGRLPGLVKARLRDDPSRVVVRRAG